MGTLGKPGTQLDVWRRCTRRFGNMAGEDNVQIEQWFGDLRFGVVTGWGVLHHWKYGQRCEDIQRYKW